MSYRVFIGSSRESLEYAEEIQRNLENARIPDMEPVCWPTVFQLGSYTLESLLSALKRSTFGVFVLAPDDFVEIRNETYRIPRDNVILEMGMFIAGVGRENTFFVKPQDTGEYRLRLPTDLDGVTGASYASHLYDNNIAAKVSSACVQIKNSIREQLIIKMDSAEGYGEKKQSAVTSTSTDKKNFQERLKEYQKLITK